MKSVFVTGGTGYIGREFSRRARKAGWEVRVLTRSEKNNDGFRAKGFSPVVGDLAQPSISNARAWPRESRTQSRAGESGAKCDPYRATGP